MDELSVMEGSKCILQVRGVRPFLSDKYDITAHKNYRYLSDSNPKLAFDVGRHINRKLKIKPTDEYEVFEYDLIGEEMPMGALADFNVADEGGDEGIYTGNLDDEESYEDFPEDLEPM